MSAIARGVEGWVRNRWDGSVEATFAGPADIVAGMIVARQRGPTSARVEAVEDEAGNPGMLKPAAGRGAILGAAHDLTSMISSKTHPRGHRMKPQHPARDWRRIHHSSIFWIGVVMCLVAIAIYVLSDDLSWRPAAR